MQFNERFLLDFFWHITFVLLFVFTIISVLIAIFSKEKTYAYYALYTFFLLSYILLKTPYISLMEYLEETVPPAYNFYSQTLFYSFYIYFFLYFLDIKEYYPKFTRQVKFILQIVIALSTLLFLVAVVLKNSVIFDTYYFFIYAPFNTIMGLLAIYKASKTPGYLKYFFVSGSIIYLSLAILALVLSNNGYNYKTSIEVAGKPFWLAPLLFFYIGIFIEQIAFSLGLSYRVKMINEKLQEQFQENDYINKQLNKSLESRDEEIAKLLEKAEKDKMDQIKSEYKSQINKLQLSLLHNQMNPHFIFNALNSIKVYLIENKKEKAVYYLNKFSKLVRNILESSRAETISLEEELKLIQLYVAIEQIRLDDSILFSLEIPDEINLSKIKIPPLTLQPFVENAIWHGLSPLSENKELKIEVQQTQRGTLLKIKDNGIGRSKARLANQLKNLPKKSLGLKITKERLDVFNKKEKLNYHFNILDLNTENKTGTEVQFLFYSN